MDNINLVKETAPTVEKKPLVLVCPYLGSVPLQTRTRLKKSLKSKRRNRRLCDAKTGE